MQCSPCETATGPELTKHRPVYAGPTLRHPGDPVRGHHVCSQTYPQVPGQGTWGLWAVELTVAAIWASPSHHRTGLNLT